MSVNSSGTASTHQRGLTMLRVVVRILSSRSIAVCLLLLAGVAATGAEALTPRVEFRLRHGDDPRWSERDWDDSDWEIVAQTDGRLQPSLDILPARTGIFWIRYRLERSMQKGWGLNVPSYLWPVDEPDAPINSVFIPGTLCYEFYWDGKLIGRSGVVGASRTMEVPGPLDNLMLIPDALLGPGPHVVALRISTYHYNFPATRFRVNPTLGNYAARLNYEARQAIVPLIGAGAALLVTAICAVLFWFVDRRRPLVICGLLAFAVALFFTLIAWRWLHQDPYTWLYPRYQAMMVTMAVIGLLMTWLLVEQFALPRWPWWLLGSFAVEAAVWSGTAYQQVRMIWMGRAMLGYALLLVTWAVWKKRRGAWLALAGVLIGLGSVQQASDLRAVISPAFFVFFGVLVVMLLCALGLQIRADRRRVREAQLTAARMEIELLKKNLQPHFLLNTLTAVSEVIEQDPPAAVRLIDDLAEGFRAFARMAGEKLVPLAEEIELCRTHLRVVGRRTGRNYALMTEGIDEKARVPPAIILTLIENGIVYQRPEEDVVFRLRAEKIREGICYIFLSPGLTRDLEGRLAGGTGLRYVKARLEESTPARWTFSHGATAEGWQTVIELFGEENSLGNGFS